MTGPRQAATVLVPAGTFLDAATRFPLPEVGRFDGFSFIVTSDAAMITAPGTRLDHHAPASNDR